MHRVAFLVYPGFELLDVSGPAAVFTGANRALGQHGRPAVYAVAVVSAAGGTVESSSGIAVETRPVTEVRSGEVQTMLVAGAEREPLLAAVADPVVRAALPGLTAKAERFGSVCSGGFMLAALGLLDGRRVATHWDSCAPLAKAFPAVTVDPDALYVVDGRLWTSAGVTTGIDMALAMIARDLDAAIAGEVAKRLILYARRPGYQSQFSPVLQAQVRGESPFADLIGWIEANLDAPLAVPRQPRRAQRAHIPSQVRGGDRADAGPFCRNGQARCRADAAFARSFAQIGRRTGRPVSGNAPFGRFRTAVRRCAEIVSRHACRDVRPDSGARLIRRQSPPSVPRGTTAPWRARIARCAGRD